MLGNSCIGKALVFIGLLLCVFGLSGCSADMRNLAEGADALLSGLADGADGVLGGVSDATEQALDFLSEAEDGRLKDGVLSVYGALIDKAGAAALTPEGELKGRLTKGADDYTGSYEAS